MLSNQLAGIGSGDSFWPGVGFGFGHAVLYDAQRYDGLGGNGKIWWAGSTNVYFWMDPTLELIGVFMTHLIPFGHADVMGRVERWTYEAIP
jgi:CubicO group peptidase (beta-lactamase class C family)